MPNNPTISKIITPAGTIYDLKDEFARQQIANLASFSTFLGVTTTALTDGSDTNPIMIDSQDKTAVKGDIVTYSSKEFIFNGSVWQEFGDMSALKALAFKDSATGSFTPSGSVEAPTISVSSAGSTTTINNPTKVTVAKTVTAAAPGQTAPDNAFTYYSVSNETLTLYQLGYTTGDSITTSEVTVKTGDASYSASVPAFTGSSGTVSVS